jgi:hypothetical protein
MNTSNAQFLPITGPALATPRPSPASRFLPAGSGRFLFPRQSGRYLHPFVVWSYFGGTAVQCLVYPLIRLGY